MAYSDPVTLADQWADTTARWRKMSAARRGLFWLEIVSSLAMLWSVWSEPNKPVRTAIWLVWAAAMISGAAYLFRAALARRRDEQNTLEGN